jgi:dTDP-4-amino-4,6-dideoxygalactose transaminase
LPVIPSYATNNGHLYYLICKNSEQRQIIIDQLKSKDILAVFHYISLHSSPFYKEKCKQNLSESDSYSERLLRLPLFYELDVQEVVQGIVN